MIVLVLWTLVILYLVGRRRFAAARKRLVTAADFASGESDRVPEEVRIPNRNLVNLLETPVLFYVACLTVFALGKVDGWSVGLAWVFVALRIAHRVVHLTYNNVMHRLRVFAASVVVLLALWIRIVFLL
ncbi:MAG: MAPEG family protein [Burkholderiales bacterium]|nr:MAPEG family protein [Burkholderiales bacterium]